MAVLDEDDEILDLVDSNDKVVGTIVRSQIYDYSNLHGHYLRAANCFVLNTSGKLWVPRRLPTKKIAPDALDYSAGGHVSSGESYEQSMVRELAEETGLEVSPGDLEFFYQKAPQHDGIPYFTANYLLRTDAVPHCSPDDFTSFQWLTIEELLQLLQNGEKSKADMLEVVIALSAYVRQNQADE